ncbi:hypothetical protein V6N12_062860 [Hibiscus sabdariffa]|uniref:Uncharacterized protein n=1 Tax=Hibiscus sabdariffa TaxID=183260 RepID=A0ABR2FAA8_9ROSI
MVQGSTEGVGMRQWMSGSDEAFGVWVMVSERIWVVENGGKNYGHEWFRERVSDLVMVVMVVEGWLWMKDHGELW